MRAYGVEGWDEEGLAALDFFGRERLAERLKREEEGKMGQGKLTYGHVV